MIRAALLILALPLCLHAQFTFSDLAFMARATASARTVATNNLVSYWKLEESGTATRVDSVGTNNVAPAGGASYPNTNGIIQQAVMLVHSGGNYLTKTTSAGGSLSPGTNDFTFTAWVRPRATNVGDMNIIGKYDSSTEYLLRMQTLRFTWRAVPGSGEITTIATNYAVTPGTWYFLAAGWDSTNSRFFLLVNGGTNYVGASTSGPKYTADVFDIGARGAAAETWDGDIDEVSYWKRRLSTNEIQTLYNNGVGYRPIP